MIGIQRALLNANENAFYYKMASYINAYMIIFLIISQLFTVLNSLQPRHDQVTRANEFMTYTSTHTYILYIVHATYIHYQKKPPDK